ncbi:MAG: hypothetical protein QOG05_1365 [Streptosporangiaceae bacterium]|nr:hypothetical protein [Streptosporangiaceae bacterium]
MADSARRRLTGEGWSLRAERTETAAGFDQDWRALVGVRRGLRLLVIWRHQDQDQELEVEAWAGEPETSEGIAVIDMGESDPLD